MSKSFSITTPIYYVNDKPHIGHAYTTIAADVLARFHRLNGQEVFFLTGTDEHGAKIAQAAEKKGIAPQQFADEQAAHFQMVWDTLNISNDDFIRTTEERHETAVVALLNTLKAAKTPLGNDFVYEGEYEGTYCVGCESYKTESDLVDDRCPLHPNMETQQLKETNWFFRIADYTDVLKEKLAAGEYAVQPDSRKNEMISLLNDLQDVAISRRSVEWGIAVPWDSDQTVYVWIEALMNYVTALGYPDGDNFKKFWPSIHLMAKDITKFHAVIWPAILLAADVPLPKLVYAHGFFTIDGQKMSKSLGNVVDPVGLAEEYGVDAVRFFLLSEFPFGNDGDVSVAKFKERYNSFLANGLGNVVARVLTMASKHKDQLQPVADHPLKPVVEQAWQQYGPALERLAFDEAITAIWRVLAECDGYIEEQKPWELAKTDPAQLAVVLAGLAETLRHVGWMLLPIMPDTAEKILTALQGAVHYDQSPQELQQWGGLTDFSQIQKPDVLFPRHQAQ